MGLPGPKLACIPQASRRGRRPEAGRVGTERRRVLDSAGWHRPWGVRCLCREGLSKVVSGLALELCADQVAPRRGHGQGAGYPLNYHLWLWHSGAKKK